MLGSPGGFSGGSGSRFGTGGSSLSRIAFQRRTRGDSGKRSAGGRGEPLPGFRGSAGRMRYARRSSFALGRTKHAGTDRTCRGPICQPAQDECGSPGESTVSPRSRGGEGCAVVVSEIGEHDAGILDGDAARIYHHPQRSTANRRAWVAMMMVCDDDDHISRCFKYPSGGTHIRNTTEIGPVKISKIENKGRQNRRIIVAFSD